MQVERTIVNFNPVFGLGNRRRGWNGFLIVFLGNEQIFRRKNYMAFVHLLKSISMQNKSDFYLLSLAGRTLVDICMELLLIVFFPRIGQLHDDVIWLQLPEFISALLCYLNLSIPLRIKEQENNKLKDSGSCSKWRHHATVLLAKTIRFHMHVVRWSEQRLKKQRNFKYNESITLYR